MGINTIGLRRIGLREPKIGGGIPWPTYWTTHSYIERVAHYLGDNLIAHFPLNETTGIVASATGATPTHQNLIPNPGFESTAFSGWGFQNATVTRTTTAGEFHAGTAGLKVVRTATVGNIARKILLLPGVKYRLRFWIRGDGTNGQTYHIRRSDFGAWLIAENTPTGVTGTDFVQITSAEFTAPAGYEFCWVYIQTANAADATFYIDDIELYPTEGATIGQVRGNYGTVTLNQAGFRASEVAASFAANGGVNFASFFTNIAPVGTSGTALIWVKAATAALTDGAARYAVKIKTTAVSADANYLTIYKSATNNKWGFQFKDDGMTESGVTADATDEWTCLACTWSPEVGLKRFVNGVQTGDTVAIGGNWTKPNESANNAIGSDSGAFSTANWSGLLSHFVIGKVALSDEEILILSTKYE